MKIFEHPKTYAKMSSYSYQFEGVHSQMKDIQKAVLVDPSKFFSVCIEF